MLHEINCIVFYACSQIVFFCHISDDKDAQSYNTDFLDAKRVNVCDMAVNISSPPVIETIHDTVW